MSEQESRSVVRRAAEVVMGVDLPKGVGSWSQHALDCAEALSAAGLLNDELSVRAREACMNAHNRDVNGFDNNNAECVAVGRALLASRKPAPKFSVNPDKARPGMWGVWDRAETFCHADRLTEQQARAVAAALNNLEGKS